MQPTYQNYSNVLMYPNVPYAIPPYPYQPQIPRILEPPKPYLQPNPLWQSMASKNQLNKWNINPENQANINNFPFGRERQKMYNYVSKQMETSIDEENKKILEKFRIDAIKNRNQRVMKHLGKIPYITENMLPGTSIDASKFVQRPPVQSAPKPIYQPVILSRIEPQPQLQLQPQQIYIPITLSQSNIKSPKIITPRKISQPSASIGIEANFQQQFPMKRKKKKKRYYTIQQQEQEQAMNKIEDMLHEINVKLKRNTELLSKSTIQNQSLAVSRFIPETPREKLSYSRPKYFSRNLKQQGSTLPTIKYSSSHLPQLSKTRSKTLPIQAKPSLKQHLNLIKRNRRRLQDLDEYIYG